MMMLVMVANGHPVVWGLRDDRDVCDDDDDDVGDDDDNDDVGDGDGSEGPPCNPG